jgi:hypothetical protein
MRVVRLNMVDACLCTGAAVVWCPWLRGLGLCLRARKHASAYTVRAPACGDVFFGVRGNGAGVTISALVCGVEVAAVPPV